jgi:hypothetical protein
VLAVGGNDARIGWQMDCELRLVDGERWLAVMMMWAGGWQASLSWWWRVLAGGWCASIVMQVLVVFGDVM